MVCSREGCENSFEPRATGGPPQRFCSTRCRKLDHDRLRPDLKAARNARYWHSSDAWYARFKQRLERRIQRRTEEV